MISTKRDVPNRRRQTATWRQSLAAPVVGALSAILLGCGAPSTATTPNLQSPTNDVAADLHQPAPCPLTGGDDSHQLTGFGATASTLNRIIGGDATHSGEFGSVDPKTGLHRFNIGCSKSLRAIALQEFFSPTVTESRAIDEARRLLPADAVLASSSTVGGCWQGQFESRVLAQSMTSDDPAGIADVELLSPAANGNPEGMMIMYTPAKIVQLRIDLSYGFGHIPQSC